MAVLNKILNILTLLLAVTALAFSFLLFKQRNELRDRADKLAETLRDISARMDVDSASDVAKKMLTFKRGNPAAKIKDSGNLSWVKYNESKDKITKTYNSWNKYLDAGKAQVEGIMTQRNYLATKVVAVGIEFDVKEASIPLTALQNFQPESYQPIATKVLNTVKAVKKRDRGMMDTIAESSKVIGHPVRNSVFTERLIVTDEAGNEAKGDYNFEAPLKRYRKNVADLKTRADQYVVTFKESIKKVERFAWETDSMMLDDPVEYMSAMTAFENDMAGINDKLIDLSKTKIELEEANIKLDETIDQLEITREDLNRTEDEIANQKVVIEVMKNKIQNLSNKFGGQALAGVDKNVEGTIINVNPDWDFVVINLGEKNVRKNWEMLIKRDNKFVAKMLISKVLKNIAIAEVLADLKQGPVKVGDKVIFPKK